MSDLRDINPVAADLLDDLRRFRRAAGLLEDASTELCGMLDVLIASKLIKPAFRDMLATQIDAVRTARAAVSEVKYGVAPERAPKGGFRQLWRQMQPDLAR